MQQFEFARRGTAEAREGARQFISMLEALERRQQGICRPRRLTAFGRFLPS